MRTLLLLAVMLSAYAAVQEDFILVDGRTLTGTYNEDTHQLTLRGGKMGLTVLPDEIKERAPAKVVDVLNPDPTTPAATKTMTADEKAAAVAGFKAGQKESARAALIAQADKADKEAGHLLAKAKAWKAKADTAAKSFRDRAALEGESWTVDIILQDRLLTKNTHANNFAILELMADIVRFKKDAADKTASAKAKRAEAGVGSRELAIDSGDQPRMPMPGMPTPSSRP